VAKFQPIELGDFPMRTKRKGYPTAPLTSLYDVPFSHNTKH